MKAIVQQKIKEFLSEPLPALFPRDLSLGTVQTPQKGNIVQVVVGVRRCGKTYRLYQEMQSILNKGYPRTSLLYFNFEDERLKPYDKGILSDVVDTFYAMNPSAKQTGAFFFFDEIQVVPEWGTFLRRMVDTQKVTMYVTGSSSKMLSLDLATEFRGRALSHELFPLSFSEFALYSKQITPSEQTFPSSSLKLYPNHSFLKGSSVFTSEEEAFLREALQRYLIRGGFPGVQSLEPSEAITMLQDYANRTMAYDVIERYGLTNPSVASAFLSRCLSLSGRELSINKIHGTFKSQGVSVSREMLSRLLSYFEEAFLLFPLREFTRTLADNPRSSSKVYAIDQGMFSAFSPAASTDEGQRLETAVFLKLRRNPPSARQGSIARLVIGEVSPKYEVDFALGDALFQEAYQLIQVSCSMKDEQTRKREIRALGMAMRQYSIRESTVVTLDEEEDIALDSGLIHVIPAWKWLLDEEAPFA